MDKWMRSLWLGGICWLFSHPALAAEPIKEVPPEETKQEQPLVSPYFLTLTEAIQTALANNHNLKIAQQRIEDARLQVTENAAQGLPQLNLTASYGRQDPVTQTSSSSAGNLAANPQFAALLGTSSVNNFRSSLTLSQVVFEGFRIIDGIRLAQINVRLMEEGLRQARQEVVFQVASAYFNALKAWQMVQVDSDALAQAQAQMDVALKKLAAGAGIKFDVLRAQNQVISVQQALSRDLNTLDKAKMNLNLVLGRQADIPLLLNNFAQVQELEQPPGLQQALDGRSEIRQTRLRKEMNELTATIQGRGTWPLVTLSAAYNIQDNQVVDGNNSNTQNLTYGVNLNWPIFDGLAASSRAQRSMKSAEQAQAQLDQYQQSIAVEVQQAFMDVQEAKERQLMARQGVEVAKEGLRIAEVSYREGVGTSLNVIEAQVSLMQAQTNLITADYDLNIGKANLYKALAVEIVEASVPAP